jgi:chemotaxis signal transduction protein
MTDRTATAWLLEYAEGSWAAFGLHSALALVEAPAFTCVPGAPSHCLGLMRWESERMPLLDLRSLFEGSMPRGREAPSHALVVAWRPETGGLVQLGAIAAPMLVSMIEVNDSQQCTPPEEWGAIHDVASAWFAHQGTAVPVIGVERLFGAGAQVPAEPADAAA